MTSPDPEIGELTGEFDPNLQGLELNEWLRGEAERFIYEEPWTPTERQFLEFLFQNVGVPTAPGAIMSSADMIDPRQAYKTMRDKIATHPVLRQVFQEDGHGPAKKAWLGDFIDPVEGLDGEELNEWLRQHAAGLLATGTWSQHEHLMLKLLLENVGTTLTAEQIIAQLPADALADPSTRYKRFMQKLRRHAIIGDLVETEKVGNGTVIWLGSRSLDETVEKVDTTAEQVASGERSRNSKPEKIDGKVVRQTVEGLAMGDRIEGDVTDVIPVAWFREHGAEVSRGLNAVISHPNYPSNLTAQENLQKIGAVLRQYPWTKGPFEKPTKKGFKAS